MRTLILLSSCAIAFILGASSASAQGASLFGATAHDFGEVEAGTTVMTTFAFENTGDQPVRITDVHASCGCTAPHYTEGPVQPGERGEVQVAFDATGRSGPFSQNVRVHMDIGQAEPSIETLVVRGRAVPAGFQGGNAQGGVMIDGEVFSAGLVPAGEPVRHSFQIRRTAPQPLVIERVHTFPSGAEVAFPERPIFRDDVVQVEVLIPGEMVRGDFDVAVALETNDAEEPVKALRVVGRAE